MKSYFLPIIIFLLFQVRSREQATEEAGYTHIDDFQVTSNPQLQGLVHIGVQNVTQQAIQEGSLPEGNYQVSQIINVSQNQDSYHFEVEVTDGQGNTAIVLFFITYDSSAGTTEVTSYDVLNGEESEGATELGEGEFGEVTEVTEVAEVTELGEGEFEDEEQRDGFVILEPSVAQTDTEIAGIVSVGVQEVTKQAIANGSLFNSTYELARVYSVQQNIANPNEYRFYVSVRNYLLNTVNMEFDLVYDESSNTVEILSWRYPNLALPINDKEVIVDEIPADYQEIDFDLNNHDTFVYEIADAALQVVKTTGYLEGKIPLSYYLATNVRSVSRKAEGGKLYYRFDLDVAGEYGDSARFTYVVSYDIATLTLHLEDMQITDVVRAS